MRRVEKQYARSLKNLQEETLEVKWGIVAGEAAGFIRRMKRAEFRWHTCTCICMEALRVMQCTREDEARVAAVQGTAVEDSRDTRRDKLK